MNLQNITLFQMTQRKLNWLSENQRVISQNIANSDTPKYAPSELRAIRFDQELSQPRTFMVRTDEQHRNETFPRTRMVTTSANHLSGFGQTETFRVDKKWRSYENSLDRNAVILEEQTLKAAENRDEYDRVATLYQKYNNMIKTSLGNQS